MLARIGRRVAFSLATLLVIATATFFLMHSIPGGPFSSERSLPPSVEANILRRYKLDQPVWRQFADYMAGLAKLDLGPSFTSDARTTNDIIKDGFPKSALLGATAFLIAFGIGVPLGVAAALRRARLTDRMLMMASVLGVSAPSFIIASLLQYVFSYRWQIAPAAGWGESPWQVVLPAVALAGFPVAFVARLVRSSMLQVLDEDYVRTARAKGLPPSGVFFRHALRNAMLPAVTYAGPLLAALLTGSFVVEDIFSIPGLGKFFVSSINDRDYTVIMGVTLFYSALLIGFNVVVDVLYAIIDPRMAVAD
ncbi:MAG: ABC transporter permease [Candidatus Sumerlaeaceae bacterium]|nr:ABC transporter permease [Candidatus Sumerlaeaceae bacterium]